MYLIFIILICAVSAEYFKQQALSRFQVSKVAPLAYSLFSSISVLSNVVLFKEVDGFLGFLVFTVVFALGMLVVVFGIQMVQNDDKNDKKINKN